VSRPEAVVVGAGPAGSVAALVLARAGVRVRLLDRASFPRPKLCGDTLNPGALSILDGLDRAGAPLGAAVRAAAVPMAGMIVTGPRGARVVADYPSRLTGAALPRHTLDHLLLEAAMSAGAEFEERACVVAPGLSASGRVAGVRLKIGNATRELPAAITVAADGRGSRLGAALGLSRFSPRVRRWAFGAYFSDVEGLTAHGEMHLRAHEYIGVAPTPGGAANVCVVRDHARAAESRPAARVVHDAVASEPTLRDRFARARQVTGVTTLGPLAIDCRAAGMPGLLLAGDAAGFVDPMTGDGLRFALRGGILAAEAALQELATGLPAFEALHAARRREFRGKWRVNRALRRLAASPGGLTLAAVLAGAWQGPVRMLVGVAGDVALAREALAAGHGGAAPCA
jgi:flavin-dependent dehydrogenase